AGGLEGDEGAEAGTLEALAGAIEGQALVEAGGTGEELLLRFDLGAELRVGPHPAMPDGVWWVLHGPGGELLRGKRRGPAIEA
ncbi:MAG TPA: hypothetical protein RMI62_17840, partial [Polyangiaceae bacterium LLY-WYZ-15_(1-7)]|nr:hypothetical protein [Polyangiaceae bacterium LLY-WYZ-15_(1-7)]